MLKKYIDQISKSEKQQLGIDFDGVIHKNSKGFNDGTIYDEPIEGAIDSIEYLNKQLGFDLVIYSCKARPDRPLINGKTGIDLIWEWLNKHNLKNYMPLNLLNFCFTYPKLIHSSEGMWMFFFKLCPVV